MKAPFPWFGGKSKVSSIVWERFGDVQNYVEPFFGSGNENGPSLDGPALAPSPSLSAEGRAEAMRRPCTSVSAQERSVPSRPSGAGVGRS